MRVLFLAHRVPYPPDKGDKIRAFHQLRGLAERGHTVDLLAFADERRDRPHSPVLAELCTSVGIVPLERPLARARALGALLGRGPLSLGYFASDRMRRALARVLAAAAPDAVFATSSTMAQYVPGRLAGRAVVDLVDVDSEKWRAYADRARPPLSWLYRLEAGRLRGWERAILDHCAYTLVTTEREAALLDPSADERARGRLQAITNGVDLEYFRPVSSGGFASDRLPIDRGDGFGGRSAPRLRIVFTGAMDYAPNVEAVRSFVWSVLPLIRRHEPRAELLIVGSNPTRSVRRLGRRPGVTVTGRVADVRPYLAAATACVVPLRIARGVQNKVLEAMASGCALVATPEAVAALPLVDGDQVLLGRTPPELAGAVLRVLGDEPLRARLGAQARAYVEREHRWPPLLERLCALLESVATDTPLGGISTVRYRS